MECVPYPDDHAAARGPVIAVIGAGASGTLSVIHLLREATARRAPLRVALIDRHGRHGLGQAYSTTHPAHLLNTPAGAMSALAGDPGHLTRWAATAGLRHDGFLPRSAYGRYLRDVLEQAERAAPPAARVSHLTSDVVALRRSGHGRALRLYLAADGRIDADAAVLATGSLPPAPPCPLPGNDRYIADPWEPGALEAALDGSPVVVLGTGLTMLDVAIKVTDSDPRTVVHAVSRHALLPRPHHWPRPAAPGRPFIHSPAGPLRLAALIRDVRARAADHAGDWQDVVDALRPQIPRLWEELPETDKRAFLRLVARYWEVHRHRVPPATVRRIGVLRAAGRLSVLRGRVVAASAEPGGVRVRVEADGFRTDLSAGWLINCTGPATDITATADPLLRHLLDAGLARPDPLRLGLDADARGAVRDAAGRPAGDIFTLGPPLRGRWYETTAIPEIRGQAAALARLLVTSHALAGSGSAA
jgi:uncharacterized NAD(P)/FAD-binding protein YdhS